MLRIKLHQILNEAHGANYFTRGKYTFKNHDLYQIADKRKQKELREKIPRVMETPLIYYLDFWQLGKIMEQEWKRCDLVRHFPGDWSIGKIKEVFSSLDTVRNRIAHCRPIRDIELKEIEVAYEYFARYLGGICIDDLIEEPQGIPEAATEKQVEDFHGLYAAVKKRDPLPNRWTNTLQKLNELVFHQIDDQGQLASKLDHLADLLDKYDTIPRIVGSLDEINRFVNTQNIIPIFEELIKNLSYKK